MTNKKTVKHETHAKDEHKKNVHNKDTVKEIDKKIGDIDKKFGLVSKLLAQSWMKKLLSSKQVEDVNTSLKPNLQTIFAVIAVLSLIGAALSFFGFFALLGLSAFGAATFFILIMSILVLVASVLNLLIGIGLFGKKKWLPFILLLNLIRQILVMCFGTVSIFYNTGVSGWISLFVMIALVILVLKNKSYFNK